MNVCAWLFQNMRASDSVQSSENASKNHPCASLALPKYSYYGLVSGNMCYRSRNMISGAKMRRDAASALGGTWRSAQEQPRSGGANATAAGMFKQLFSSHQSKIDVAWTAFRT